MEREEQKLEAGPFPRPPTVRRYKLARPIGGSVVAAKRVLLRYVERIRLNEAPRVTRQWAS